LGSNSSSRTVRAPALSTAEFTKLVADETEKWAQVIRAAGIKAE